MLRDPAQSEEVTQEVFLEIWRTATRFDPARGRAMTWVMTMAHARAVDRVRSAQAASDRDEDRPPRPHRPYDEVAEAVESGFERVQVRRCLGWLTDLQRESVTLAYYGGYTYSEVADCSCRLGHGQDPAQGRTDPDARLHGGGGMTSSCTP